MFPHALVHSIAHHSFPFHPFPSHFTARYLLPDRPKRLTVSNDVLLYRIAPESGNRIQPSPQRAETDTGHFFTVLSEVTKPEHHGGGGVAGKEGRFDDATGDERQRQGGTKPQASVVVGEAGKSRRGVLDAPQTSSNATREVVHGFDKEKPGIEDRYVSNKKRKKERKKENGITYMFCNQSDHFLPKP